MIARAFRPTRAEAVASIASAVLFVASFPPVPLVAPVFVCLAPLAVLVARQAEAGAGAQRGALAGFWFGALAYGIALYWIATALSLYTKLAVLGWLAAVLLLAVLTAIVVAALHAARRATGWPMAVLLPVVWVAGELTFTLLGDLAFPWLPLGLATATVPLLAQIADVSGVHGVSFWIAATNGLAADMYLLRDDRRLLLRRGLVAATIFLAVVGYGWWRMRTIRLVPMGSVTVVQPNIPQQDKWQEVNQERIVSILASVTRDASGRRPKLVVWPEAALPDFLFRRRDWLDTLSALATATRTPILLGVLDVRFQPPLRPEYFNGAMLVDGDGRVRQPTYRKRRLVPVVERVPFIEPRLVRGWSEYFGGYSRGRESVLLHAPLGAIGTLVCYESIFPALARDYRRRGASLLVNVTNDAWFGRTFGPHQHHAHSVLRAIETRLAVARAANTGISGYIDPLGRVQTRTPLFVQTSATFLADRTDATPPYVRLGNWIGTASLLATASLLVADWRRRTAAARGETTT